MDRPVVPVVLLTGFLGSGKTTLLNRLMAERPPAPGKLAVVVNELGDVGIDADLLPPGATRQVELPGGCICCALAEDLEATLLALLDSEPEVEMVVIETTGIAEPLPIAWTLAAEPLCHRLRLAAVVTVVDAAHHEEHRPLMPSVDSQVEYADLLALTKLDLLPGAEAPPALVASLRERNEVAPILAAPGPELAGLLWQALDDPALEGARARDGATEPPRAAEHGFRAVALPIEETLDFEELSAHLEALPPEFVRIKGIARVVDESTGSAEPRFVAFHRVGARVSSEPLPAPSPGRIVAIGPGITREPLLSCLRAAVLP